METVFEFSAGYCPRTWYTTPSDYDSKTCIRFGPSHSVTIAIFERIKPISTKDYHMLVFVRYTFIFPCTICKITFRLHHCLLKRYYTEEDTILEEMPTADLDYNFSYGIQSNLSPVMFVIFL